MPQSVAVAISVALFVIAGVATWYFIFHIDSSSFLVAVGVPSLTLCLAIFSLVWSCNDNYYEVKSGTVINQSFTPAHQNPPTIVSTGKSTIIVPGAWVPDDWAIEVQGDNGHNGWFHFDSNVFDRYPRGSHYPT